MVWSTIAPDDRCHPSEIQALVSDALSPWHLLKAGHRSRLVGHCLETPPFPPGRITRKPYKWPDTRRNRPTPRPLLRYGEYTSKWFARSESGDRRHPVQNSPSGRRRHGHLPTLLLGKSGLNNPGLLHVRIRHPDPGRGESRNPHPRILVAVLVANCPILSDTRNNDGRSPVSCF